jgi:hypothetical protein
MSLHATRWPAAPRVRALQTNGATAYRFSMALRIQTGVLFVPQGEGRRSHGAAVVDFSSWSASGDADLKERHQVGPTGSDYEAAPGVVLGMREFKVFDAASKNTAESGETTDKFILSTKDWGRQRGTVVWDVDPAKSESKIIRISIAVIGEV